MQHPQPFTLKEIRSHGTKSFPCAFYRTRSARTGTLVKHHWHDEVEILYFSGGSFLLDINMEQSTQKVYGLLTRENCTALSRAHRTARKMP